MPPTASSYIPGIDVVTRDADGIVTPLGGETVRVVLASDGTSIDTFTTDDNGFLESQTLASVESGVEIVIRHDTLAGSLRAVTGATPEAAWSAEITLVLDDAFATTRTADFVDVYLRDNTDPLVPVRYLGSQPKNTVVKYPFEPLTTKDVDILAVSRTHNFEFSRPNPADADLNALGSVGGAEIDYASVINFPTNRVAGRATSGTGALEALTMPAIFSIGAGAVALASQSANQIFAGPTSGGSAAPAFRALVAADIPSLDAAKITSGTIAAARLGSGSSGSSKFLREDSTWQTVSVSPAGSNTQLQYNNSGAFGASSSLTWNGTTLQVGSAGKLTSPNSSTVFLGAVPGGSYSGTDNIVLGAGAGVAITSGTLNVLGGSRAGEAISSGTGNLLFGYAAGYGISTGSYNTGFGYACLAGNQSYSVALGTNALGSGSGSYNVGIGYRAGVGLTSGYYNTLIGGDYAGGVVTSGIGNTCNGWFSGSNITSGSYNCALGYNAQVDSATGSYQTNINDTFYATSTEARIHRATYKQRYDGSNYLQIDVSSAGAVTLDAAGASAKFTFADNVELNSGKTLKVGGTQFRGYTTSGGTPSTSELPNDKDWCFHYDSGGADRYVAINLGGTIYGVALTAI